jgi:uncharacterized membrane protein
MDELFKTFAGEVALAVEALAVLLIAFGAVEALFRLVELPFDRRATVGKRKSIWVRFGMWLVLGLEFELAADIVRSVIAPTWFEIGQLGAIAVIRTFLNYFLAQDLEKYAEMEAGRISAAAPGHELEGRTA